MNFLVTGATGFVGQHLVKLLVDEGHQVSSMSSRKLEELCAKGFCDGFLDGSAAVCMDITQKESVFKYFELHGNKFDGIFHLAAFTDMSKSLKSPNLPFSVNAIGTANLCHSVDEFNPETVFMNCSSGAVYGECLDGIKITENFPVEPVEPYGVSKACAEMVVAERVKNGNLRAFTTRTFSTTGPYRKSNFSISSDALQIAKIIKGKREPVINVGNLESKRVIIDVRDVVIYYYKLMMKALNNEITNGDIFNVAGENLYSIGDCIDMMLKLSCYNEKVNKVADKNLSRTVDIATQYPDTTKIKTFLKWQSSIPIEKTLQDLLNYWLRRV